MPSSLKGLDEESLRKLQNAPVDEVDRFYCLPEAPNKQAVEDHHGKYGLKCEWITEVKTAA